MPVAIRIDFDTSEAERLLGEGVLMRIILAAVARALGAAAREILDALLRELQLRAPVDTGRLRMSVGVIGEHQNLTLQIAVSMAFYGAILNSRGRHSGWIDRAFMKARPAIDAILQRHIDAEIAKL